MENIEDLFDEGHDKKDLQDKSLSPINQVNLLYFPYIS